MKLVRQITTLTIAAAIPASVSAWVCWRSGKRDSFRNHSIPLSEVSQWEKNILWVDARSEEDFARGHILNAVHLTEDDWNELLPALLSAWEPERVVVVYCGSRRCRASEEVAKRLREEVGLKSVYTLRGGWEAWKGAQK